jgi:hypothetical protein
MPNLRAIIPSKRSDKAAKKIKIRARFSSFRTVNNMEALPNDKLSKVKILAVWDLSFLSVASRFSRKNKGCSLLID